MRKHAPAQPKQRKMAWAVPETIGADKLTAVMAQVPALATLRFQLAIMLSQKSKVRTAKCCSAVCAHDCLHGGASPVGNARPRFA